MKSLVLAACGLLAVAGSPAVAGSLCDGGGTDILWMTGKTATLALSPSPAPIPVSEPFELQLEVCDAPEGTEVIRFDARMPAHGHGMTYRPELEALDGGTYVARNVLLHMPGSWEFIIDTRGPEHSERLRTETVVGP
jgi:hypothetical protein